MNPVLGHQVGGVEDLNTPITRRLLAVGPQPAERGCKGSEFGIHLVRDAQRLFLVAFAPLLNTSLAIQVGKSGTGGRGADTAGGVVGRAVSVGVLGAYTFTPHSA